jgi:hypothetical protein
MSAEKTSKMQRVLVKWMIEADDDYESRYAYYAAAARELRAEIEKEGK